jgi:hypothetical protein
MPEEVRPWRLVGREHLRLPPLRFEIENRGKIKAHRVTISARGNQGSGQRERSSTDLQMGRPRAARIAPDKSCSCYPKRADQPIVGTCIDADPDCDSWRRAERGFHRIPPSGQSECGQPRRGVLVLRKWTVPHAAEHWGKTLQRVQIVERFQNRCDALVRRYYVFEGRGARRIEFQLAVGEQILSVQHVLQFCELAVHRYRGGAPWPER